MEHMTQLDPPSEYRAKRDIREKRRVQASALIPGVLLIAIGLWALLTVIDGGGPAPWQVGALLLAGFGLSLLARFLVYGRTEPGLMFLGSAVTHTTAGALAAWYILTPDLANLPTLWPAGLLIVGASLLLTLALSTPRDRRLLLPGLACIAAGAAALPFTLGVVPAAVVNLIATYWPLLFGVVGLAALTSVLRRRDARSTDAA